ncbi:MAG: hypothetical protein RLZZ385_177 [Pseudomonadota bacterium]
MTATAQGQVQRTADKFVVTIKDVAALRSAYLPFLINGGLLIPFENFSALGQQVFLVLYLLDEETPHAVSGRIAWSATARSGLSWGKGIGVQFDAGNEKLQLRLRSYLNTDEGAEQPLP